MWPFSLHIHERAKSCGWMLMNCFKNVCGGSLITTEKLKRTYKLDNKDRERFIENIIFRSAFQVPSVSGN